MEYLPCMPLHSEHVAGHARSIPRMPVFSRACSWVADRKYTCDFKKVGAKKLIIGSNWNNGEKNRLDLSGTQTFQCDSVGCFSWGVTTLYIVRATLYIAYTNTAQYFILQEGEANQALMKFGETELECVNSFTGEPICRQHETSILWSNVFWRVGWGEVDGCTRRVQTA